MKRFGRATAKSRQPDVGQEAASLSEAIKAVATGYERKRRAEPPAPVPADASMTEVMQNVASRLRKPPSTRQGRKGIVIYVEPQVAEAIHRLAADLNNATVQALGVQAFEYLFERYNEPWPA